MAAPVPDLSVRITFLVNTRPRFTGPRCRLGRWPGLYNVMRVQFPNRLQPVYKFSLDGLMAN